MEQINLRKKFFLLETGKTRRMCKFCELSIKNGGISAILTATF